MKKKFEEKPVVAFMPSIFNLGETIPLIETAKKYEKLGGKAIFIGQKGVYSKIIEDNGFKYITLTSDAPKDFQVKSRKSWNDYHFNHKNLEDIVFNLFPKGSEEIYTKIIEYEVRIFRKENVRLVVTGFHIISKISAKIANLPILFIISGVGTSQYYKSGYATFPENYENILTKLVPNSIKNYLTNLYILKSKKRIKGYNSLARKYRVPELKYFYELFYGDYTLIADDINFLNIKPSEELPTENFTGPIIANKFNVKDKDNISDKIEKHLRRPGKAILVTMGSITVKKLILDIINVLNNSEYNCIVVFSKLKKTDVEHRLNENVIFFESVPSIKEINEKVDLAIIHGGRGTIYTSALSGKPAIGYPMHIEQQYNLDNLVRHKTAIRLSKNNFSKKQLITAINEIFNNYDEYLTNAQRLKEKLQESNGAENAGRYIYKVVTSEEHHSLT